MLENRHLRYFVEVAKCLHVTKAAERLHIAQPALTQNIHQLEEDLGVELFRRDGHRFALTHAGKVFLVEAERSLLQFEHARRAAQRASRGEIGRFELGFQSTAGLAVVPRLLQRLQKSYPEIEVSLHEMGSATLRNALRSGEIDAAIIYALPDDEFAFRTLAPEPLIVALPEGHPLAERQEIAFKDLAGEKFILPPASTAEVLNQAVLSECAEAGFQPRGAQMIATLQTGLGLVAAHVGISILPSSVEVLARRGIVFRPISGSTITIRLSLFWPLDNASPMIARLLEIVDQ